MENEMTAAEIDDGREVRIGEATLHGVIDLRADRDSWRRVAERLQREKQTLADATKGLIGLCQLVRNRDDIPADARQALTYNHRIVAAYEALSTAGMEDHQMTITPPSPSDTN